MFSTLLFFGQIPFVPLSSMGRKNFLPHKFINFSAGCHSPLLQDQGMGYAGRQIIQTVGGYEQGGFLGRLFQEMVELTA